MDTKQEKNGDDAQTQVLANLVEAIEELSRAQHDLVDRVLKQSARFIEVDTDTLESVIIIKVRKKKSPVGNHLSLSHYDRRNGKMSPNSAYGLLTAEKAVQLAQGYLGIGSEAVATNGSAANVAGGA